MATDAAVAQPLFIECMLRQVYTTERDIGFISDNATQRQSEPSFMDMNLRAVG